MELPNEAKARVEIEDPIRVHENKDKLDPMRPQPRKLIAEPMCANVNTLVACNRADVRSESDEPKWTKLSTEIADPNRPVDRTLKEEPSAKKSMRLVVGCVPPQFAASNRP
jgi:hypothetical protein